MRKSTGAVLRILLILVLLVPSRIVQAISCQESVDPACSDDSVVNGYWWKRSVWIPGYPSIESWFKPAPVWSFGSAVFYGPGGITANAKYRGFNLKGYVDGVALMSPADIGAQVWLKRPEHAWEGPFLVVDCAAHQDIYPIIKYRREIVEVSWKTAKRWKMVSPNGDINEWKLDKVEVSKVPPSDLKGTPIDYVNWWLANVKFGNDSDVYTPYWRYPNQWLIDGNWVTFHPPALKPYRKLLITDSD